MKMRCFKNTKGQPKRPPRSVICAPFGAAGSGKLLHRPTWPADDGAGRRRSRQLIGRNPIQGTADPAHAASCPLAGGRRGSVLVRSQATLQETPETQTEESRGSKRSPGRKNGLSWIVPLLQPSSGFHCVSPPHILFLIP